MKLGEQDYKRILKRLERMEAFLKSYIASLEGTNQKLIRRKVPVYAEAGGDLYWKKDHLDPVEKGELIYFIDADEWHLDDYGNSPASGDLFIFREFRRQKAEVAAGQNIAEIWEKYVPV